MPACLILVVLSLIITPVQAAESVTLDISHDGSGSDLDVDVTYNWHFYWEWSGYHRNGWAQDFAIYFLYEGWHWAAAFTVTCEVTDEYGEPNYNGGIGRWGPYVHDVYDGDSSDDVAGNGNPWIDVVYDTDQPYTPTYYRTEGNTHIGYWVWIVFVPVQSDWDRYSYTVTEGSKRSSGGSEISINLEMHEHKRTIYEPTDNETILEIIEVLSTIPKFGNSINSKNPMDQIVIMLRYDGKIYDLDIRLLETGELFNVRLDNKLSILSMAEIK